MELEDEECCVCFTATTNRTPCAHTLCRNCYKLLPQPICPICRRDLNRPPSARQHAFVRSRSVSLPALHAANRNTLANSTRLRGTFIGFRQASTTSSSTTSRASTAGSRRRTVSLAQVGAMLQPLDVPTPDPSSYPASPPPNLPRTPLSPTSPDSPTSPSRRSVAIVDLLGRISRMSLEEIPLFIEHVAWLRRENMVLPENCTELCRSVRRRASQLVGQVRLGELPRACDIVASLVEKDELPAFAGDGTPRKTLEARLGYLAHHPPGSDITELVSLEICHRLASECHEKGLVSVRPRCVVVKRVVRWLEAAQLSHLTSAAPTIAALAAREPELVRHLNHDMQLQVLKLQPKGTESLTLIVDVLLAFHEQGMQLVSGRLEETLFHKLQASLEIWTLECINEQLAPHAAVLRLSLADANLREQLRAPFSRRLVCLAVEACASLRTMSDLVQVLNTLQLWGRTARRAHEVGLLKLSQTQRATLLGAFAECETHCSSHHALAAATQDVHNAQWAMISFLSQEGVVVV